MKKTVLIALVLMTGFSVFAQTEVTVEPGGSKIIKGFMTKEDLASDSSFTWFARNQKGYTPQPDALSAFTKYKDSINIIAFGGTWCGDTQNLLPKFFALAEAAGLSTDRITLIGVDRGKKTLYHLTEAFNVTRVPTFIVMKNGVEIGRVVEYGRTGLFDKELGQVLTTH